MQAKLTFIQTKQAIQEGRGSRKPFYTTPLCFTNQSNKKYNIEKYNKILAHSDPYIKFSKKKDHHVEDLYSNSL